MPAYIDRRWLLDVAWCSLIIDETHASHPRTCVRAEPAAGGRQPAATKQAMIGCIIVRTNVRAYQRNAAPCWDRLPRRHVDRLPRQHVSGTGGRDEQPFPVGLRGPVLQGSLRIHARRHMRQNERFVALQTDGVDGCKSSVLIARTDEMAAGQQGLITADSRRQDGEAAPTAIVRATVRTPERTGASV
jgi:hypothetical protein